MVIFRDFPVAEVPEASSLPPAPSMLQEQSVVGDAERYTPGRSFFPECLPSG